MLRLLVKVSLVLIGIIVLCGISGCITAPAPKPEFGPAGNAPGDKPQAPLTQRFNSPPATLFDLEKTAGFLFKEISKENWSQAQSGLADLRRRWEDTKATTGDIKGIKEGDEALAKLSSSIESKNKILSFEHLVGFMGAAGDTGKNYKLSPISDIIGIGNGIRNVGYFVGEKDWTKAAAKAKELEDNWSQVKPSLEKFGILGEITKSHAFIRQLRDAVAAENAGAVNDRINDLNESLGRIREYYRPK